MRNHLLTSCMSRDEEIGIVSGILQCKRYLHQSSSSCRMPSWWKINQSFRVWRVLYDLQLRHFCPTTWYWTSEFAPQSLHRMQTILLWYDSGIGVAAISMSSFSHTFDISHTDLEQRGHAYCKCCCISFRQFTWIVWPHGKTLTTFVESNRYSKHTGQSWCIAPSTHGWLFFNILE